MKIIFSYLAIAIVALYANNSSASDLSEIKNTINNSISSRSPSKIHVNEVRETQIPGVYEVRHDDTSIIYSDAKGDFIFQGSLINTKTNKNLTDERVSKLAEIDFKSLPFSDSFSIINGTGQRHIAIFEDPNCGYCKKLESDLQKLENVTISIFLDPILGSDSLVKSKAIWCADDKAKSWQDWMIRGKAPNAKTCDTEALSRNTKFGSKHKISGTPTIFFEDGTRYPGVVDIAKIEKVFAGIQK